MCAMRLSYRSRSSRFVAISGGKAIRDIWFWRRQSLCFVLFLLNHVYVALGDIYT